MRPLALAVKGESNRMKKTIICCGSKQRANAEEKTKPIPVKAFSCGQLHVGWITRKEAQGENAHPLCLIPTVDLVKT